MRLPRYSWYQSAGWVVDNVLELTVVTGKGDILTCSPNANVDLFNSLLGGMGQTAIIVSAVIPLETSTPVSLFYFLFNDLPEFLSYFRSTALSSSFEGATATIYSNTPTGIAALTTVVGRPQEKKRANIYIYICALTLP